MAHPEAVIVASGPVVTGVSGEIVVPPASNAVGGTSTAKAARLGRRTGRASKPLGNRRPERVPRAASSQAAVARWTAGASHRAMTKSNCD